LIYSFGIDGFEKKELQRQQANFFFVLRRTAEKQKKNLIASAISFFQNYQAQKNFFASFVVFQKNFEKIAQKLKSRQNRIF
jgi:hypothetical protein